MKKNNPLKNLFSNSEIKAAPFVIGTCLALDAFAPGLGTILGISAANSEKIADALKQPIGSIFSKITGDRESKAKAEKNHTNPILFAKASEKCLESAKQKLFEDFGLTTVNKELQKIFKNKKEKLEKSVFEPFFEKLNNPEFIQEVFQTNQQLTPGNFLNVVFEDAIDFEAPELKDLKVHYAQILETITQTFKEGFVEQFKKEISNDEQLKASYHTHLQHSLVEGQKEIKELLYQIIENQGSTKKIEQHLTKSPIYPQNFIGRGEDLKKLREKLVNGDNLLLLVNGHGGMGKTTLAARYYHDYKDKYSHLAWVLNEGDIKNALLAMRPGLGFTEAEIKMPVEEQFVLLQTKLANLSKPCLLVIDNVNNPEVLQNGILTLHGLSGFHIVLTSRITEFHGTQVMRVKGLKDEDALTLFKKHYPIHDPKEDELLQQIIVNVDRNTLVIELLAKNLKKANVFEKEYSLQELAEDLQKGLTKLRKSKQVATVYQAKKDILRTEKPEDIIMAMYEVKKLSEGEKKLISIFALLPNEPITYSFLNEYCEYDNLTDNLSGLKDMGWIDFDLKEKSFKANQVVQDVVLVKQKNRLFDDAAELVQKLSNYLEIQENLAIEKFALTEQMARYASVLLEKLSVARSALAWLYFDLGNFYNRTGNLSDALRLFKEQHTLFQTLSKANTKDESLKNGLAISYSKLGETYAALGNLEKALQFYQERYRLAEELYRGYPNNVLFKNGLAISYEKLGQTHSALGNLEKALQFFQERSRLGEELYRDYPNNVSFKNGLAISYSNLGSTHSELGNLDKALQFFQERSRLGEELYTDYPNNVSFKNGLAISYSKLGEIHAALGNLDKALQFYELDANLTEELYKDYTNNVSFKNGLAISYSKLGSTHSALGNLDKALQFFQERSRLGEELFRDYPNNVSFKSGLSISYEKLGETHLALGNPEKALQFFQERSRLGEELYGDYPNNVSFKNGLAISYSKLGSTHSALGNLDKAQQFFQDEAQISEELYRDYPNNVSFKNGLAISYSNLGSTHSALGNLDKALQFHELDANLTEELYKDYTNNVSFKNGLAISYSKLGETHAALGNLDKAQRFFQERSRLAEELYRDYPNNVSFKNGLAISIANLGVFNRNKKDLDQAKINFEKAKVLLEELVKQFPNYVEFKKNLNWVNRQLENL